jgi:hypothetical protein
MFCHKKKGLLNCSELNILPNPFGFLPSIDLFEVCELRMRYRDLFEGMFKTLRAFAPSSSEFIPFLACHHIITDFEINAFLNQDSYRLLKFVSDLVSIFDTG